MERVRSAAWLVAAGILVAVLGRGLRPETFVSGDSGAKLIAAHEALAHPGRPLDVTSPVIGTSPAPDLLGTFFPPHQDHAHALTSPLFPLVSAMPLAVFGERGLYLIPGLAWVLTLWLAARLSRAADAGASPAWGVLVLVAGTPLLFYALEFWEHMPAVALTTGATLAALHANDRPRMGMAVGALTGAAFLFRPEAVWYGFALALLAGTPSVHAFRMLAGFVLTQVPIVIFNILHFSSLTGPHLAANLAATLHDWLPTRWVVAGRWFANGAGAPVALLVCGAFLAHAGRRSSDKRGLIVFTTGTALVVAATGAITLMGGLRILPREGLWATFPLAALALLPPPRDWGGASDGTSRSMLPFLRDAALLFMAMAWLTTPHDGGAQWGPRFLLPAFVPLAIASGAGIRGLVRGRSRWAALPCVFVLVFGSIWIQRSAYRELLVAKRIYSRIVAAVGREAGRARYVLTDVWWLELVSAHHRPRLTFLYADSGPEAIRAVQRLESAGVSAVLIVQSAPPPRRGVQAPWADTWLRESCYRAEASTFTNDRSLHLTRARCVTAPRGRVE